MLKKTVMAILIGLGIIPSKGDTAHLQKWAIDYSKSINISELKPYKIIILDSDVDPIVESLRKENKEVFAYLSLGEISNNRSYFNMAKQHDFLLKENPNWPGSYVVDIRNPNWTKILIEAIIPDILQRKFSGLFLDTLDHPIYLEQTNPQKYEGMTKAAINLVKLIHTSYPDIKLMLNRAFNILPEVAPYINIELAESIYSNYDFSQKKYHLTPTEEYKQQRAALKKIQKKNPQLQIFTLDYWSPDDPDMIREIYKMHREEGFSPYVSTVDLMQIMPEPL